MSRANCPRCGGENPEPDAVLCAGCRAQLLSEVEAGSAANIRVSPIIREALAQAQPGEDFDEALLRALKTLHPGRAAMLLPALLRMIEAEAQQRNEDRQWTLKRLADSDPGPEITLRTSSGTSPVVTTVTESKVFTFGDGKGRSLNELPPDVRRAVEAGMGKRGGPRVGCSVGLLAGVIAALVGRS